MLWCKGTVFFFPCESSFSPHFWKKSIGWMKKLFFFFSGDEKKKTASRSNEWMANELSWEKKNTEKTPKNAEKKNTTQSSIKKGRPCPKLNEWPMNFFLEKSVFFLRFWILNEWMSHELSRGQKNTLPLGALIFSPKNKLFCRKSAKIAKNTNFIGVARGADFEWTYPHPFVKGWFCRNFPLAVQELVVDVSDLPDVSSGTVS